jgi:hypothetical protein
MAANVAPMKRTLVAGEEGAAAAHVPPTEEQQNKHKRLKVDHAAGSTVVPLEPSSSSSSSSASSSSSSLPPAATEEKKKQKKKRTLIRVPEQYTPIERVMRRRCTKPCTLTMAIHNNEKVRARSTKKKLRAALDATEALLRAYAAELKMQMIVNDLAIDEDGDHGTHATFIENVVWDCCGADSDGCDCETDHEKDVDIDPTQHTETRHRQQVELWHEVLSSLPVEIRHTPVMAVIAGYATSSYTNQLLSRHTQYGWGTCAQSLVYEYNMQYLPYVLYATPKYDKEGTCAGVDFEPDWQFAWRRLSPEERKQARESWETAEGFDLITICHE